MKHVYLLTLTLIFLAPTLTDQIDSDFQQGFPTNVNLTDNEIRLPGTIGSYTGPGSYLSRIFDLGSNPLGTLSWSQTTPPGTSLLITTRESNDTTTWTSWSIPYSNPSGSTLQTTSRYLQYQTQLTTTNPLQTPRLNSISIQYTEQGPQSQEYNNTNLNENTNGTYRFTIQTTDTVPILTKLVRYRTGGSWSTYENMTQINSTHAYIDIPPPNGNWNNARGANLQIQTQITNNNTITETQTFTEFIDLINQPPTLSPINDQIAIEGEEIFFSVTASDPDDDNLTYTSSVGNMTKFTNTIADFRWTPFGPNVGITNVTITVRDQFGSDSQNFSINTTPSNQPPQLAPVEDITAYYGDLITIPLLILDANIAETLFVGSTPPLPFTQIPSNDSNYRFQAEFNAFDDYKGEQQYIITVRDDGGLEDETNMTLTINYCGDNICQSAQNETALTCRQDCETLQETRLAYITPEFPPRICTNQTINITVYNASSRYECFLDGKTTDNAAAWCSPLDGADVTFFYLQGNQRIEQGSSSSNTDGLVTFLPRQDGRYRAQFSAEGYVGITETFTARTCGFDITNQDQIIETQRPQITPTQQQQTPLRTELPQLTQEETNWLVAAIFYVIIPLLLAALVYVGNAYYQVNKDSDPTLLKLQIAFIEFGKKPAIQQVRHKIDTFVSKFNKK